MLQELQDIAYDFLKDVKVESVNQAFILGTLCGNFMKEDKQYCPALKDVCKSMQALVEAKLLKTDSFNEQMAFLIQKLERNHIYQNDFQNNAPGTPILDDEPIDNETMALIKKLQEEDKMTQQRLKKAQVEEQEVDCQICYTSLMDSDIHALESCVHLFHKDCLNEHITQAITERRQYILCPSADCKKELTQVDIIQTSGKEKYEDYTKYTLAQFVDNNADNMSWCPTPDCKYAFVYDGTEEVSEFTCPLCKGHYCMACRIAYHKGQTCKEYQITHTRDANDVKFEKFVKGHKLKMCAKCKFFVQKNQGCNHMTCRCGYEFCYVCGGKYMQCECIQKQREQIEQQRQRQLEQQRLLKLEKMSSKRGKKR